MKKTIKIFVMGIIISTLLISTVFGIELKTKIDVVLDKVNLSVNGNDLNTRTILYQGTTFVPIRAAGEALNKEIDWNQKTSTVSINDKESEIDNSIKSSTEDFSKIKLYSKIANNYKSLKDFGETLDDTEGNLSVVLNGIVTFNNLKPFYTTLDYFEQRIEWYNDLLEPTQKIIAEAKKQGIDISNMNDILKKYSDAINQYKSAYDYIMDFALNNNQESFNNQFDVRNSATEVIYNQIKKAQEGYLEFYLKIQAF